MVDNEDDVKVESDTSPEISLHAISSIKNSQIIQLQIFVAGLPMLGLVDSSSTHNFISETAGLKAGLTVVQHLGFQVAVANGEKITSSGICEAVKLQVGKEIICIDLYVITLGSFDVVLGVKWLRT